MDHLRTALLLCCLAAMLCMTGAARAADDLAGNDRAGSGPWILSIPGTGDSQVVLRSIAARFNAEHPHMEVVIPDSVGSSGGIQAVLSGRCELGRTAREPSGREREAGLVWRVFAWSPVVFVANLPSAASLSLTFEHIVGIYSGAVRDYAQIGAPPGKIYPVMRERGDSSLQVLKRHIPGFGDIREPVGKIYYTTPETVAAIERHPGAMGFVPLAVTMGLDLRILPVEGFEPTPDSVRQGEYLLITPLAMVHKGVPGPEAEAFLRFLAGPEAMETITRFGCVPAGEQAGTALP